MTERKDNDTKDLELQLAELDLSEQSEIKDSLRYELQQRIAARRRGAGIVNPYFRRFNMFRKPLPALGLVLVLSMAVLALVHPETLAKLAEYLNVFKTGEHSFVYETGFVGEAAIDSILAQADQELENGRMYMVQNSYGGFSGGVPEGKEPVVREVYSLNIARQLVDYPLQVPTYFNTMIPERLRFSHAQIMPDGSAMLYFGIGPFETMIHYAPVDENRSFASSASVMVTDSTGRQEMHGVTPQLEELQIQGRKVFWQAHDDLSKQELMGRLAEKRPDLVIGEFGWEENGVSYLLDGRMLTREEGIKIIQSLKPMPGRKRR
jgi:hypothetical protein